MFSFYQCAALSSCCKLSDFPPFLSCPCHSSLSFLLPSPWFMCVSLCVSVCARVVSFWVCVCVCVYAFCSQPLCGKQSLWRALAFHNQSLAPLHTPPPLPRIQTWTHTALVSFGQLIPNFVCCLFIYFLLVGSSLCLPGFTDDDQFSGYSAAAGCCKTLLRLLMKKLCWGLQCPPSLPPPSLSL